MRIGTDQVTLQLEFGAAVDCLSDPVHRSILVKHHRWSVGAHDVFVAGLPAYRWQSLAEQRLNLPRHRDGSVRLIIQTVASSGTFPYLSESRECSPALTVVTISV